MNTTLNTALNYTDTTKNSNLPWNSNSIELKTGYNNFTLQIVTTLDATKRSDFVNLMLEFNTIDYTALTGLILNGYITIYRN